MIFSRKFFYCLCPAMNGNHRHENNKTQSLKGRNTSAMGAAHRYETHRYENNKTQSPERA
jgi:hypothetical protein